MNVSFSFTAIDVPLSADGKLELVASKNSSMNDYDFLMGPHTVLHKKLTSRLCRSNDWVEINGSKTTIRSLKGIGNIEQHVLHGPDLEMEAMALRLFNPKTKLWSLYWADSDNGTLDPPVTGSFDGDLGIFFGKDHFEGQEIWVQFQYDRSDLLRPKWGQAFSLDGKNWEWNWFMLFSKSLATE